MRGIEGVGWRVQGAHWIGVGAIGAIGAIAWLFKYAYAQADATQLQGLLYPLAMLLNALTPLQFVPLPSGEWWDARHHLLLVKACAGGNFLLVSWLGYVWQWREKWQRHGGVAVMAGAAGAAWLTVLLANALRVLSIAYIEEDVIVVLGLSATDSHRLIGIVVYFAVLMVQMAGALPMAVLLYLGVTVCLPLLRALSVGMEGIDDAALLWRYVQWTLGIPLGMGLMGLGWQWRTRHTATHKP
jgi:exosortase K